MSRKREVTENLRWLMGVGGDVTYGAGPLACLSLFPVAELDRVS